ncbi:MAG: DUF4198 domain-containing protein [Pseudomonadota bacterium]
MKELTVWVRAAAATIALILSLGKANSHEFWIDAEIFEVPIGGIIEGNLRVGQEFEGAPQSYLPSRYTRFDITVGNELFPVEGRLGDIPALSMDGLPEGLAIVAHETTSSRLTYREWDRFVRFAEHKDFTEALTEHVERGISQTEFRESFSRHVKALFAIGDGAGEDRALGLETEIVALANPYTDDLTDGLAVQVFRSGTPRADAQVELFQRAPDGEVSITLHRTDDEGIAVLPVMPDHVYFADAVVLEAREPEAETDPVWHSYWAGLTFAVP